MGANPIMQDFLEKSGLFTSMATEEGVHHFIREINLERHDPFTVDIGEPEKQAITSYRPGFFEARATPSATDASPGFYLGRVLSEGPDEMLFEREFNLETDG